jgi:hypothetical protein
LSGHQLLLHLDTVEMRRYFSIYFDDFCEWFEHGVQKSRDRSDQ